MSKKTIYLIIIIIVVVIFGALLTIKGLAPSNNPTTEPGIPANMAISNELGE